MGSYTDKEKTALSSQHAGITMRSQLKDSYLNTRVIWKINWLWWHWGVVAAHGEVWSRRWVGLATPQTFSLDTSFVLSQHRASQTYQGARRRVPVRDMRYHLTTCSPNVRWYETARNEACSTTRVCKAQDSKQLVDRSNGTQTVTKSYRIPPSQLVCLLPRSGQLQPRSSPPLSAEYISTELFHMPFCFRVSTSCPSHLRARSTQRRRLSHWLFVKGVTTPNVHVCCGEHATQHITFPGDRRLVRHVNILPRQIKEQWLGIRRCRVVGFQSSECMVTVQISTVASVVVRAISTCWAASETSNR